LGHLPSTVFFFFLVFLFLFFPSEMFLVRQGGFPFFSVPPFFFCRKASPRSQFVGIEGISGRYRSFPFSPTASRVCRFSFSPFSSFSLPLFSHFFFLTVRNCDRMGSRWRLGRANASLLLVRFFPPLFSFETERSTGGWRSYLPSPSSLFPSFPLFFQACRRRSAPPSLLVTMGNTGRSFLTLLFLLFFPPPPSSPPFRVPFFFSFGLGRWGLVPLSLDVFPFRSSFLLPPLTRSYCFFRLGQIGGK